MAIVVFFVLGLLWLIGGTISNLEKEKEQSQFREIQSIQRNLEKLIAENREDGENLEDLKNKNLIIYKESDIFIINDSNETALRNYGQEIYQVLSLYLKPRENEVKIMIRVLERNIPEEITLITASRKTAEQALVSLLYMDVPIDLANLHLQLINNFNQLIFLLSNMENILTTPTVALKSAISYNPTLIELFDAIIKLDNYFSDHNIVLKDKIEIDFTTYFND